MRSLQDEDEDAFKKQFSQFIKNKITADNVCVVMAMLYIIRVQIFYLMSCGIQLARLIKVCCTYLSDVDLFFTKNKFCRLVQ